MSGAGTFTTLAIGVRNHPRDRKGRPQDMNRRKPIPTVVEVMEGEIYRQHGIVLPGGFKEMIIGVGSGKFAR